MMIDFRHETFLHLCEIRNYTKTAEVLNITQPAVSQHIRYLEEIYGGKLLIYEKKMLTLTPRGKILYDFLKRMFADFEQVKTKIMSIGEQTVISFGATLTIGEFVMPEIILDLMRKDSSLHLNMLVENTKTLIEKLYAGKVAFVLLEGYFNKAEFGYKLFRKEEFIPMCSSESPLSQGEYILEDLLECNLVLREIGSGTRDILEQELDRKNLSVDSFNNIIEIGNMNAIKELVTQNIGITFMYKAAAEKELEMGKLCRINVKDFNVIREFNFVYLKDSVQMEDYYEWFKLLERYNS